MKYVIDIPIVIMLLLTLNNCDKIVTPVESPPIAIIYKYQQISPPEPTITITNGNGLLEALLIAKSGDVIYIPGQILVDLTPALQKIKNLYPPRFEIPSGVTLMGDGTRFGQDGATIFVTEDVNDEVFRIYSGARITGLKIKGPQNDSELIGIHAYNSPGDTIIIDNCELWGWNLAAVRNRGDSTNNSIKNNMIIRNNYFHDNVHNSGYGIATAFNTYTLIEYNQFKNNKHDISSAGKYGCDYIFRYNISVMQWLNPILMEKGCSVDIHGWPFDENIEPNIRKKNRQAGSRVEIYGNHFKDEGNYEVIQIRGIPEFYVQIYDNSFASTNINPIEQKYIDVPPNQKNVELNDNKYRVKF